MADIKEDLIFEKTITAEKVKSISMDSLSMGGYVSPHDLDLEKAVLGSIILERDVFDAVSNILRVETFFSDSHKSIYSAILQLFTNSEPIDMRTVVNQLRKNNKLEEIGGAYYIASLTTHVGAVANVEYYAKNIVEMAMRRELIANCVSIQKSAYDSTNDIFDVVDAAEQSIFEVTNANIREAYKGMNDLTVSAIQKIQDIASAKEGLTGVPTGFHALDSKTCGWQKSDLVIIAARPGMGKTAFVLSALRNAAIDHNCPVALFSLEMSSVQLVYRMLASEAEINNTSIKSGALEQYEWERLIAASSKLSKAPIYIDDTPALSIFELRTKCRRLKSRHNIQLIVVDYLQLMCGEVSKKATNREQEIASISRALKNIAKELDVPVIALSQLSRAVEARGGSKRPQLSDLRESGAIEQDADMVLLLYRPDYYGILEDENGESMEGKAEVIIAKYRNGAQDTIELQYINRLTKFTDLNTKYGSTTLKSKINQD